MRVDGLCRLKIVAVAAFLSLPSAASATKAREPADQIFPFLSRYYSLPPASRDKFAPKYCIEIDGQPAKGQFTLEAGTERKPVVLDYQGCVEQLPTAEDLAKNGTILMEDNAPAGSHRLSINISLNAVIPSGVEISAADCAAAIVQANAGVKKLLARFGFDPKIRRVAFPGGGSGVVILTDGHTVPLNTWNNIPVFDPDEFKGADRIRLKREPTAVIFPDGILPVQ